MRYKDTKYFLNRQELTKMLNLRRNGIALTSLAKMFGVDESSIRHQCDKYLIIPLGETYTIERITAQIIPLYQVKQTYEVINGERINLGKSYQEYLAEAKYPYRFGH